MARYYFDFQDGAGLIRDDDGLEFGDLKYAETEAAAAATRVLSEIARQSNPEVVLVVRDEHDQLVIRLTARLVVERLR